jgi:hypothetical protein
LAGGIEQKNKCAAHTKHTRITHKNTHTYYVLFIAGIE